MWLSFLRFLPFLGKAGSILKGNVRLIVGGLIAVIILGTGWYIDSLKDDIKESERLRSKLATMLVECQDANSTNLQAVRSLQTSVRQMVAAVSVSEEQARQAEAEAARREAEAEARLESTLTELEELRNAEPSCAAIANLDIGAACPAAVERLRERARAAAGSQD